MVTLRDEFAAKDAELLSCWTREKIMALPAGPILDQLVFDYSIHPFKKRAPVSTRIASAWKLLEYEFDSGSGGCFSTHVDGWMCQFADDPEVIQETPQLAICKAVMMVTYRIAESWQNQPDEGNA